MQASSQWTEPKGTLGAIVNEAEVRVLGLESRRPELVRLAEAATRGPSLREALSGSHVAILAEVKRRSPSKGLIAGDLGAVSQASAYARGGAAAVSILTEPAHFGGSIDDLTEVRAQLAIPVLKKDFHVQPIQLLEARALGASAALLIARALSPSRLSGMMRMAAQLELEVLVEVRDEEELARALGEGASMVGVNNRNLETLEIDPSTSERIIPLIPAGVVAIAESGIRSRSDVERYAACGADAVLVGSSLSTAEDAAAATRALTLVPRRDRAR